MNESQPDYEFFSELTERRPRLIVACVARLMQVDPVYVSVVLIVWLAPTTVAVLAGLTAIVGFRLLQHYLGMPHGPPKTTAKEEAQTQA